MSFHSVELCLTCLAFIMIGFQTSGTTAEAMCGDNILLVSPKTLETVNYPSMVTSGQCQCTIVPTQTINELNLTIRFRRGDQEDDCSHTQLDVVNRDLNDIVCPKPDAVTMESLSLMTIDRPVITLLNTYHEFISAQVIISSAIPFSYNVSCNTIDGSIFWQFEKHGTGFDDGIDPGIKVAVVVLFFILTVLFSATVRLIVRVRRRKEKVKKRIELAKQKRIDRLAQTNALAKLEFANLSTNQSPNSNDVLQNMTFTGRGCLCPLQEEENHQQTSCLAHNQSNHSDTPRVFNHKKASRPCQDLSEVRSSIKSTDTSSTNSHYTQHSAIEKKRIDKPAKTRARVGYSPNSSSRDSSKKSMLSDKSMARNNTDMMPKDSRALITATATDNQCNVNNSSTSRETAI